MVYETFGLFFTFLKAGMTSFDKLRNLQRKEERH